MPAVPNPSIDPLYTSFKEEGVPLSTGRLDNLIDVMGKVSMTSQFKVSLHLASGQNDENTLLGHLNKAGVLADPKIASTYDFMCNDASLPGLSFNSVQEMGSRQGVIEYFPNQKIYPPFEVTFYVDTEFKVIRLFEEWINFIYPLYSHRSKSPTGYAPPSPRGMSEYNGSDDFFRLRYPNEYKKIISVTKFERNFRVKGSNKVRAVPTVTYRLIDAYPNQLNSIPVTYEGSYITKTTVSFLYSRFIMQVNPGYENDV